MKHKIAALLLAFTLLMPCATFAADITITGDGAYTVAGTAAGVGPAPFTEGELLYLPVAAVLEALGIDYSDNGKEILTAGARLRVGYDTVEKGSVTYVAKCAPVLRDGVIYADIALMQQLYNLTISQAADGLVSVQYNSAGAEITLSKEGVYTAGNPAVETNGPVPVYQDEILYLPVRSVLSALGFSVSENGNSVTGEGVVLRADDDLVTIGGKDYIAKRKPIISGGVLYADSQIIQSAYGVAVTEGKDGLITISYGNLGDATSDVGLQTDDSWYYELVKEEVPQELSDVEIIMNNVAKGLYDAYGNPHTFMDKMRPDGAFTDIDYKKDTGAEFMAVQHINRIADMCAMVYCPENEYYRDPEAMDAIVRATEYYLKHKYVSTNWWWNDIGIPQAWQDVVVFRPEGLGKYWDDIITYCQGVVGGGNGASSQPFVLNDPLAKNEHITRTYTGSGPGPGERIYVSMKELFYAGQSPEEQEQIMRDCMAGISMEMGFISTRAAYNKATVEGDTLSVQRDFSYHDHGTSFLPLAYGQHYLNTVGSTLQRFKGTSYRLTDEAVINMQDALLDGWRWYYYNGADETHFVQNAMGRGSTGASYTNQDYRIPVSTKNYITVIADTLIKEYGDVLDRKSELQDFVNYIAAPTLDNFEGNRYFWVSDYFSHRRKNWGFSVLVPSSRMYVQETFATQGAEGLFYEMGPQILLTHGDNNAYPGARDWNRLAGTTVEMNYYTLKPSEAASAPDSDLAGGSSDGMYGTAMVDFAGGLANGIRLKRSWFAFDNEVVCLGAGIQGQSVDVVSTTVEQSLAYGAIKTGTLSESKDLTEEGDAVRTDISGSTWALNGTIGYVLTGNETAYIENGLRSGDNARHDIATPKGSISEQNMFFLGIDHGISPEDGSYQYTILPETTEDELKAYVQNPKAEILSNTTELQAVWHNELKILQAAFYKPGSVETPEGLKLAVTQPCSIMVRLYDDGTYSIHASDPQQRVVRTSVTLSGAINANQIFEFKQGEKGWLAGKTMHYYSDQGFLDTETYNPNEGEQVEFEEAANLLAISVNGELLVGFNPYKHFYELETFDSAPDIKAKGNFSTWVMPTDYGVVIRVADPKNPTNETYYSLRYTVKEPVTVEE